LRYPALVIFDMDGLMFDTEKIALDAWNIAAEHYGFKFERSLFEEFVGLTNRDILNRMSVVFGDKSPVHDWRAYMRSSKGTLIDEHLYLPSFKKKGLDSLLTVLKANQVKTAVASSSEKQVIIKYLTATNTKDYIDYCVSGDEVVQGKPNPEIFLTACRKANVAPADALVLEDSPAGIRAARDAGIPSFFIPDIVLESEELSRLTTKVFPCLEEVERFLCSLPK
jgi:beta-phosphoglucomutase